MADERLLQVLEILHGDIVFMEANRLGIMPDEHYKEYIQTLINGMAKREAGDIRGQAS